MLRLLSSLESRGLLCKRLHATDLWKCWSKRSYERNWVEDFLNLSSEAMLCNGGREDEMMNEHSIRLTSKVTMAMRRFLGTMTDGLLQTALTMHTTDSAILWANASFRMIQSTMTSFFFNWWLTQTSRKRRSTQPLKTRSVEKVLWNVKVGLWLRHFFSWFKLLKFETLVSKTTKRTVMNAFLPNVNSYNWCKERMSPWDVKMLVDKWKL